MKLTDYLLVYITRFNLSFEASPKWQGLDEEWLKTRIEIMRKFLIPSLRLQKDQDFVWLVLVHPDTPRNILKALQSLPQLHVLKTDSDINNMEGYADDAVKYLYGTYHHKWLITARIDSDDAVNSRYGFLLKHLAKEISIGKKGVFADYQFSVCFFKTTCQTIRH
jgi:hypothetical protein